MTDVSGSSRPGLVRRVQADSRIRYLVVGGGTACVEFLTFALLVHSGVPPVAANVISFCLAVVVNFSGYRWWSFAGDHGLRGHTQFVAYLTLALANVTITSAIINRLVELGTAPWMAKLGCMAMVTVWNYFILNLVIFRRTTGQRPAVEADRPAEPRDR